MQSCHLCMKLMIKKYNFIQSTGPASKMHLKRGESEPVFDIGQRRIIHNKQDSLETFPPRLKE